MKKWLCIVSILLILSLIANVYIYVMLLGNMSDSETKMESYVGTINILTESRGELIDSIHLLNSTNRMLKTIIYENGLESVE